MKTLLLSLLSMICIKRVAPVIGILWAESSLAQSGMFVDTVYAIKNNGDTINYFVMFRKGSYANGDSLAFRNSSNRRGLVSPLSLPISTATQTALNLKLASTTAASTYYLQSNPSNYISSVPAQSFGSLTGKPTTLSGYGITDAYPLSGNPSGFLTSLSGAVLTSRTISTTSPLTGGGDLSSNRTFAINNGAADNATKGAVAMDSVYFNDNGSGIISFGVNYGSGSVSANAVTINHPRGKITYASPSIAGAGTVSVTFTNSFITATSNINIGLNGNGSNLTLVNTYVKSQTAGSCIINIQNLSLLSLFNTGFVIDYLIVN